MKLQPILTTILAIHGTGIQAVLRSKFQHWFPRYEQHWIQASASCHSQLTAYHQGSQTECNAPCACAADCLLKDITGTIQSNFASAQVLLGLIPAILVFVGPTIAEVAVLSTYRPLLAVLLTLGSPAISLGRLLGHVDVREPFRRPVSRSYKLWSSWLSRRRVWRRALVRVVVYIGAVGAIANNVQNSVYLDMRTISGWRCGALLMPLWWSLLAGVVHLFGMIAIRVRPGSGFALMKESVVASNLFQRVVEGEDGVLSESLFWFASLCAVVHMVYGVLELSSLVFIDALEALKVFVRYAVSASACQFILLLELMEMRDLWEQSSRKNAVSLSAKP